MKKSIALGMMFILIASILQAQARFGVTGGAIFSKFTVKYGDVSMSTDSRTGFTAGVFLDQPLGKSWSFQPALNYVQKGTRIKEDNGQSTSFKTVVHTVEIPLNMVYHLGSVFIGAGPAVTYGLSGKSTYKDDYGETSENIKFGDGDEDDMHAFDFGANVLAGYSFTHRLQVSAHYYAGLTNLAPGGQDAGTMRNNYFALKLGFLFSK